MGLFKNVLGAIFGRPDKVSFIPASKIIAGPSEEERRLLSGIMPLAIEGLERATKLSDIGANLPSLSAQMFEQGFTQTADLLNRVAQGELPEPFKRAINRAFTEQFGNIVNQASVRGILNSSVTQNAIAQALNRALDEQVRYLPTVARLGEEAFRFGTYQPLSLLNTLGNIQREHMQLPLHLYSQMLNTRLSLRSMPIVKRGSGGLLGAVASGLGQGLALLGATALTGGLGPGLGLLGASRLLKLLG